MRRKDSKDSFKEELIPTRHEVSTFDPREGECCTAVEFRPDLEGGANSVYNKSVARVFAKSFNSCQKYEPRDERVISSMLLVHLKTLHRSFVRSKASGARKIEEKK